MHTRGQKRNKSRTQSSGAGTYTTAKAQANAAKNAARVAEVNAAVSANASPMFVDSEDNKQRSKTSESKSVLSPGVTSPISSQPSVPTPPSGPASSPFNLGLQPLPATGRSSESKLRTVRSRDSTGVAAEAVSNAIHHINEKVIAARTKAERWAEAEARAMRVVEEERLAREAEEKARQKAEREAKEKLEREAKEKAEREKAEREAKEKAVREAKEKAEREAKEIADKWIQTPMSTESVHQFMITHFGPWYWNRGGTSSNSDSVSEQRYNETRPTFGEIYPDGVQKIFDNQHMRAGEAGCDTLVDLGSGCGKVLVQALLQF